MCFTDDISLCVVHDANGVQSAHCTLDTVNALVLSSTHTTGHSHSLALADPGLATSLTDNECLPSTDLPT